MGGTEAKEGYGSGGVGRSRAGRPPGTGKDSRQLIKIDDTAQNSYRELKLMLSYLPDKLKDAIEATVFERRNLQSINRSINKIRSGIWAVLPMVCSGDRCPYGTRCPLLAEGAAPVTQDCPMELYLLHSWLDEYATALEVARDNKIEMGQVGTIVMCDLMIMRCRNWMAMRPDGHIDLNATGTDNKGNVVFSRDISKEIMIEEKYDKIKQRNLEALLATREAKAKYDVIDESDASIAAAKMRAKGEAIIAKKAAEGDAKAQKLNARAEFLEDVARGIKDRGEPTDNS